MLVKDLFPIVNGVFKYIDYTFWDFTSDELDIQLVSRCGDRRVAPIIRYIRASPSNNKLNENELSEVADLILKTYKFKWDRLSGLPLLEYDILKNYLDQYEEVLKDDDSTAESKVANKATRNLETSKLATSTGSNAIQNASNNSETESTRIDNFSSDFTRTSSDNTTRTDNLVEDKTETEGSDSTRTDNLTDSKSAHNSESITHQGGTYAESTTRQLAASGSQNSASGVYGFNSSTSVADSDSSNTNSGSENETINKTYSGSKSDSTSTTIGEDVDHTGTQRNVTDIDKASNKTNTGTQTIAETVSVTDNTTNSDDQVNTTTSEGTSNTTNSSTQKSVSSSEVNSGNASKLDESSVISRALNRARMYTHKGNIGNFTPQQLIKQEIELWRWNFIDEILNDVKDFISIPIY